MKKFEKIFFSMIAMIMMVTVGSVFTSCSNDDDDFRVPAQETQLDQALDQDSMAPMTRGMNVTWYSVSSTIKNRYYSSYQYASNWSSTNVANHPVAVGFYTALNATHNLNYLYTSGDLSSLCSQYPSLSKYVGYQDTNDDFNTFKTHITSFVTNKARPVAIYASTQTWSNNVLIVWAVSSTGVRVTRISDSPSTNFGNNNIIELTWQNLFDKAIDASSVSVANVAYMDSTIY